MAAPTNYDQTNEWLAEVDRRVQDLINILKGGIDVGQSGTLGNLALIDTLSESPIGNLSALQQSLQVENVAGRGVIGPGGDLLAKGAYGIGVDITPPYPLLSMDEDPSGLPNGSVWRVESTVDNRPGGDVGVVVVYKASTVHTVLRFYGRGSLNNSRQRTWNTGWLTGWRKTVTNEDVVGTVSMNYGVPSGAIFEQGSNANGIYTKLADKTLLCSHLLQVTVPGGSIGTVDWELPTDSASAPRYQVSLNTGDPSDLSIGIGTGGTIYINNSSGSERTLGLFAFSYGRW